MKLHNRPFHWWGDIWTKPSTRSLADLLEQDVLGQTEAHWLIDHIANGQSLIVATEASRAGKSTLAFALLQELPVNRERIYIRGTYEPFDWLSYADPANVTLLVNEFSPDLPVYCWGKPAKQVLTLAAQGFQVICCMHGETVSDLVTQLRSKDVGATPQEIAALDTVVFRNAELTLGHRFNHVSSIENLSIAGDTVIGTPIFSAQEHLPVR